MNVPKLRFKEFQCEWESKKIIDLADYVDYRGKTPTKTNSGVLLVTAKNIKFGFIDYDCSKEYISESDFEEVMRRGKVAINDVLFTTEAPLGNIASVDRIEIALAQRVIKYRGKENILDSQFLKQIMLSERFQNLIASKATGGTVLGIKGSVLHKLNITAPSLIREQTKIATFLSAVDEKIAQLSRKHELLQQYKQGMMQQLFSQKLRFKDDKGEDFPEWGNIKLKDFLSLESRPVNKPDTNYHALGVRSHFKGLFNKIDSDPSKISMDTLYRVKKDDFVVNITFELC